MTKWTERPIPINPFHAMRGELTELEIGLQDKWINIGDMFAHLTRIEIQLATIKKDLGQINRTQNDTDRLIAEAIERNRLTVYPLGAYTIKEADGTITLVEPRAQAAPNEPREVVPRVKREKVVFEFVD